MQVDNEFDVGQNLKYFSFCRGEETYQVLPFLCGFLPNPRILLYPPHDKTHIPRNAAMPTTQ